MSVRVLSRHRRMHSRRGVIIVLTAILMVFLLAMIAFAVDIGYIANARTEIQRATDAAAYAGAGALVSGTAAATAEAQYYLVANKVAGQALKVSGATIEFGNWNITSRVFTPSNSTPNAIRVTAVANQQPLFFGNAIGTSTFNIQSRSVATYQPRDIGLVLDYSGSMAYDSQFKNIGLLGQTAIEANLLQIYQQLGSPAFGTLTFAPVNYGNSSSTASKVLKKFKLDKVAYPYPGGSWEEYVEYVQSDYYVQAAGYQNEYGYLTWVNYLLYARGGNDDTPKLKNCSVQPVTALKDAVDVFLSFLSENDTDDRVALAIYTYSDGTAFLESGLTKTYSTISNICRSRQAGHYIGGTNISAGMTKARLEVQNNARPGAQKMLVVMTDGVVNLPTGNTSNDKAKVIAEANLCAAAKIPIVTIALGGLRRHCVDAASRRHHRRRRLRRAGRSTDRASASSTRSGVRSSGRGPTAETCPVSRSSYASWDVSRRTLICSCLLRECVLPPETEQGKFLAGPLRNPAADGSRVIAVCRSQSPFQRNLRSRAFFCNRNAYTGCRSPRLPDEREFFQLGDALRPMVTKGIIIDPYVSVGTRRCGKPGTDESIRSTAEHRSRCPKELDSALTRIVIHRPKSARRNG